MGGPLAQATHKARVLESDPNRWRQRTRDTQATFRRNHPEKKSAWNKVYKAVRSGQLVRPGTCDRCLISCKPEASHDDYAQPLDVEWLCKPCHADKDKTLRRSP